MAILNLTPDSFYDGAILSKQEAIDKGLRLIDEGADILDFGAESSRPGSKRISCEEELDRLIPILSALRKRTTIPFSVDTMKPKVARIALENGANIINDVTGLEHPEMRALVREKKCGAILMHMQKTPETMQDSPYYPMGIVQELYLWFKSRLEALEKEGILRHLLWIDPGIGFGKTVTDNIEILNHIPTFTEIGLPLLIGLSRKSFIQKILKKPAEALLLPTVTLNSFALLKGASIIRVHDVKEHREMIDLLSVGLLP